ncbi:Heat shock factor protein 4 [Lonchura striata]|uniref:Heat shock factor protein 4 n=1 Tax=Lonchura striata TaxID=40157 RepID=A0A218UK35_9PASE|nr:Heat shock factor protein 4 [Lonchura striata domestica]
MQDSPSSLVMDGYSSNVPAFLTKLWTLVEDPETNHLICWSSNGTSFHVFDQGRFAKEVLPKYFKHNNMASFVRQLNMYGFRKVVNIEQGGLVKPERDDTEFQHLCFLQGHEHLLEHIKRKVSVVKNEETKMRQEDLSRLLYEVQILRSQQENMECQVQDMKQQNEVLWREVVSLRQNHSQQQKVINKVVAAQPSPLKSIMTTDSVSVWPAPIKPQQHWDKEEAPGASQYMLEDKTISLHRPLMLDNGNSAPPVSKFSRHLSPEPLHDPYFIQSPSTEPASCLNSPAIAGGPIISDVTEASPSNIMNMQSPPENDREKCLMLIKEEPVSPGVKASTEPEVPLPGCRACPEPPVLPVAMVQSVLEGKGSCGAATGTSQAPERRGRRALLDRTDISDPLEGTDWSLEGLQLLLRSQQYSLEPASLLDVFNPNLSLSEWNLTEMEASLPPMQRFTVDLEKSATELPPKVFNPPFNNTCPGKDVILESAQQLLLDRQSIFGNDLINLPENSSLYVPSENIVSYMSSVGVQGDIPLNLSSSTDNSQ